MRKVILSFVLLITLSGCVFCTDTKTEVIPHSISDMGSSESDAWMEVYTEAIINMEQPPKHITLVDIDFDGVPELFLSELGAQSLWIYHGFTYKENYVIDMYIPDNYMPINLDLYQDKETKETIWFAKADYKSGAAAGGCSWYSINFNDMANITKNYCFGYSYWESTESVHLGNEIPKYEHILYLDSDETRIEMQWDEIEEYIDTYFSKYEKKDTHYLSSFVNHFLADGKLELMADNLDKERLFNFFGMWITDTEQSLENKHNAVSGLKSYFCNNRY